VIAVLLLATQAADARRRRSFGTSSYSSNGTFGLGLEIGSPSGLNGKYFLTNNTALNFGVGYISLVRLATAETMIDGTGPPGAVRLTPTTLLAVTPSRARASGVADRTEVQTEHVPDGPPRDATKPPTSTQHVADLPLRSFSGGGRAWLRCDGYRVSRERRRARPACRDQGTLGTAVRVHAE
jgi:hypothetical protein